VSARSRQQRSRYSPLASRLLAASTARGWLRRLFVRHRRAAATCTWTGARVPVTRGFALLRVPCCDASHFLLPRHRREHHRLPFFLFPTPLFIMTEQISISSGRTRESRHASCSLSQRRSIPRGPAPVVRPGRIPDHRPALDARGFSHVGSAKTTRLPVARSRHLRMA